MSSKEKKSGLFSRTKKTTSKGDAAAPAKKSSSEGKSSSSKSKDAASNSPKGEDKTPVKSNRTGRGRAREDEAESNSSSSGSRGRDDKGEKESKPSMFQRVRERSRSRSRSRKDSQMSDATRKDMLVAVTSCRSDGYYNQKAPGTVSKLPRKAPTNLKLFHELAVGVKDAYAAVGETPQKPDAEKTPNMSREELDARMALWEFVGNLDFVSASFGCCLYAKRPSLSIVHFSERKKMRFLIRFTTLYGMIAAAGSGG